MNNELQNSIVYLLIFIVIIIVIWLLIRELVLWYFKINKTTSLLEAQVRLLQKIVDNTAKPEDEDETINESAFVSESQTETESVKKGDDIEETNESYLEIIEERKHKVRDGQAMIIHIKSKNVRIVTAQEYDELEGKDEYKVIYEK